MAMLQNNILHLSKKFKKGPRNKLVVTHNIYKDLSLEQIIKLQEDLITIKNQWDKDNTIGDKCLISSRCYGIISKSNRIKRLFHFEGKDANEYMVGARFVKNGENDYDHLFTYCFDKRFLINAINTLECLKEKFSEIFGDYLLKIDLKDKEKLLTVDLFDKDKLPKTHFLELIQELSYIKRFEIYICDYDVESSSTVTFYNVGKDLWTLLDELGVRITTNNINGDSALLNESQYNEIKEKAGYLIAMAISDFTQYDNTFEHNKSKVSIEELAKKLPEPNNEPIIGVIDTLFNENVYFSKWVEYKRVLGESVPSHPEDYGHGTAVSSLIVDLPNLNPDLDDGCGHFKVRHFGVCLNRGGVSTFKLMQQIETIIETNQDVHVWNLSLGSEMEVNLNFISPEASILDKLQNKYPNIIFIVAGTNLPVNQSDKFIGSPADTINSIVVNSVRKSDLKPASYSRHGPVLSFYIKPDISYYGGDEDEPILVAYPYDTYETYGTSFAAPLIARKMAYMIDVLKIPRECAKALLIDSTIGWHKKDSSNPVLDKEVMYKGRGIPPININDIIQTKSDEIRLYIDGISQDYFTYEYDLPVPLNNEDKYPYIARATLCSFPKCSRKQGVDYTDIELEIKFGRTKVTPKPGPSSIVSINNDKQNIDGYFIRENNARQFYRKWDNVKVMSEKIKSRLTAKKKYDRDNWGIQITYLDRISKQKEPVKWGLVITLKAIDGKNRIDEFIQKCILNNWIVNEISVDEKINAYNKAQVDVEWE